MADGGRLWDKGLPVDGVVHRFTVGDDPTVDLVLVPYDCIASAAHARMLAKMGHISTDAARALIAELARVYDDATAGRFVISPELEDGHTAIEARLTERLGETGRRIHLARSRNDQVLTALRLYMRDAVCRIGQNVAELAAALDRFALRAGAIVFPGYTHMRRAMPSSPALWARAYAAGLAEDAAALAAVDAVRLARSPSGAAAGYGVPLPVDRAYTAHLLAFDGVQANPIDAMNGRGRIEAALADALAQTAATLEKLLWDTALFTTEEFGFFRLDDAFTTGSSIMPQKRNPDVIELLRGRCRELVGLRDQIARIAHGLPGGYHRDQQLLKAPLVRLIDTTEAVLAVAVRAVDGLHVDAAACARAMTPELFAVHAALERTAAGEPFRDAYRAVGRALVDGTFEAPGGADTAYLNELDPPSPRTGPAAAAFWADRADALHAAWRSTLTPGAPTAP